MFFLSLPSFENNRFELKNFFLFRVDFRFLSYLRLLIDLSMCIKYFGLKKEFFQEKKTHGLNF